MPKYAAQLAIVMLCFGGCAAASPAAPSSSNSQPATASADMAGSSSSGHQQSTTSNAPAAAAGRAPSAPVQSATSSAAGSGSTAVAGSQTLNAAGSVARADAGRAAQAVDAGSAQATEKPATPGSCEQDPLALLRGYAPKAEDLAKDYAKYLDDGLGPLTCATAGTGQPHVLTQTIFVPPGATYDGRGETLTADAAAMRCDTSEGEQGESQRPLFLLAPSAQLKNVTIAYPGCDGVHMMGDNVLDHVVWPDVGEDAASVRSYFPGGKIEIKNSEGHKASDKMFQFNAPCDVRIEHFQGSDMGKLVRQNGGTEFELHIDLNDVMITEVVSAVVQSDSPMCFIRHHALSYMFKGSGDKSDRVFRDIPPGNVVEY